jgi:hypothetical protein
VWEMGYIIYLLIVEKPLPWLFTPNLPILSVRIPLNSPSQFTLPHRDASPLLLLLLLHFQQPLPDFTLHLPPLPRHPRELERTTLLLLFFPPCPISTPAPPPATTLADNMVRKPLPPHPAPASHPRRRHAAGRRGYKTLLRSRAAADGVRAPAAAAAAAV